MAAAAGWGWRLRRAPAPGAAPVVNEYSAGRTEKAMTTFAELARDNPNIREQYDIWRQESVEAGTDPTDWASFREHVTGNLGAPDPGEYPPEDFVGEDFKAANPDWTARWYPNRGTSA